MSQQGVLMGDGGENPAGNDAMSTSGDSVNQNMPPPPLGGEDVGGSLAPQDNVLPGGSTFGSVPLLEAGSQAEEQEETGLVPFEQVARGAICFGPIDLSPSFEPTQQPVGSQMGGSGGTAASASVAAAASVLTHTALNAAQQSAIAGQQAQHASRQSAIAGQQAQHASEQSAAAGQHAQEAYNVGASALRQTTALRDETS